MSWTPAGSQGIPWCGRCTDLISEPIVIWGAGAVGGSIGAWLHRAGRNVLFVDSDVEHVRAINASGLKITGPVDEFVVRGRALLPADISAPLHTVLLAVKAHHTTSAMADIAPLLLPDGYVVSVQNGLNERWIADAVGAERTVGCFVNFGADVLEPGVVMRGNRGSVVVGELDGAQTPRIRDIHELFQLFEPDAILTNNIHGYLWGKLAYGSMLFATALAQDSIADVLASAPHRPLLIGLAREALAVAAAYGIEPEGFDGIDPVAFGPADTDKMAYQSLDALVAFNRKSAKTHSGVWRDLAIRRRRTEVDAQVGLIAELGGAASVHTPLTHRLVELIHDVEEGRRAQSWETLGALEIPPSQRARLDTQPQSAARLAGELAVMRADHSDLESSVRSRLIVARMTTLGMFPVTALPLMMGLAWLALLPAFLWAFYTLSTWYHYHEVTVALRDLENEIEIVKACVDLPDTSED